MDVMETTPSIEPDDASASQTIVSANVLHSGAISHTIISIMLMIVAGLALLPMGMSRVITPSLAEVLLISGGIIAWCGAYVCQQSGFAILSGGLRMAGTLIGIAGVGIAISANTFAQQHAIVVATLLVSAIAGVLCMNVWKEIMIQLPAVPEHIRLRQAHTWHLIFGGLILWIIFTPLSLPNIIMNPNAFMLVRIVPVALSSGMAISLLDRTREQTILQHLGVRVAYLGIGVQISLLVANFPLSIAWGVALVLVFAQVATIVQWVYVYQNDRGSYSHFKMRDLAIELADLREQYAAQEIVSVRTEKEREALVHKRLEVLDDFEIIVHDLNHTINTIFNLSSQLTRSAQNVPDEIRARITSIFVNARRAGRDINQADAINTDSYGIIDAYAFDEISVLAMLTRLIDEERLIHTQNTLIFETKPPIGEAGHPLSESIIACWDQNSIESALNNVLINARKYSAVGSTIEVRAWTTTDDYAVTIAVTDHGIGIAPEHHEAIFERHFRVNYDGRVEGKGLGLVSVKRSIERHQGSIVVLSALSVGTTLRLTIPLNVPHNTEDHTTLAR